MSAYRAVLASPGVLSLLILGFLARIPFSTLGLLLTLHTVQTLHESYLSAGLIVTSSTLGTAISSPWRGRRVDQVGLRRALVVPIAIQSVTLIVGAYSSYSTLVVLAFVGGFLPFRSSRWCARL